MIIISSKKEELGDKIEHFLLRHKQYYKIELSGFAEIIANNLFKFATLSL